MFKPGSEFAGRQIGKISLSCGFLGFSVWLVGWPEIREFVLQIHGRVVIYRDQNSVQ